MAKRKYPSELNTRQIRVNVNTWLLLKEFSQKQGITIAELVDQLIAGQAIPEPITVIPRTQLRMIPTIATIAVNGSKAAALAHKAVTALANKPKGVRYG